MSDFKSRLASMPPDRQRLTLQILPQKLAAAGQADRFHRLLTDFDFLDTKVSALGPQPVIEDYELTFNADITISKERADSLKLIQAAIRLSAHILVEDKTQLAGQLLGRLLSFKEPEIQRMLNQVKHGKTSPWLRPLNPMLTPPGGPLLRTLSGHTSSVNAVTVTPDGQLAVSASADGTLKVWDLHSGMEVSTLTGHTGRVNAVTVTPDGQLAVSASADGTLKLWNLSSSTELFTLIGHTDNVVAVAITPNGKRVISASADKSLKVWDLETGEEVFTLQGHSKRVTSVAVTPNGKQVISASIDKTLKVWDLETGESIASFIGENALMCCAVAPDGMTIVVGEASGRLNFMRLEGC